MCKHEWTKFGETSVCKRCGLTRTSNGMIFFDRPFANIGKTKKRRKK